MATSNEKQLSDGNADGTVLGQDTSDLISFYGVAPIAQPAAVTSVTTTGATSTTNAYGFTTAAQADAIVTAVNAVVSKLALLGLIATEA